MNSSIITSALPVFRTLQLIANSDVPLSTADLSRAMKLPSSTVHRFLVTLERAGYVTRYAGSPRFIPGNMPQHLCRALFNRFPISRISWPHLQRLARLSPETVTLFVRVGWFGLRIEEIGDASHFTETTNVSPLSPLHEHLEGLAILAFLSETEIDGYRRYLRALAITAPAKLWSNLKFIRKMGFASAPLRSFPTHAAFACPIRDRTGDAAGSMGFIGPTLKGQDKGTEKLKAWINIRDELEEAFQKQALVSINPFMHLDLHDIDHRKRRTKQFNRNSSRGRQSQA